MTNKKTSFLFSLKDTFEYTPEAINKFIELGEAPLGLFHIAVFFRQVVSSKLTIDCVNAVKLTKLCTLYNIVNARGTVYGMLFACARNGFRIEGNSMIVNTVPTGTGDYSVIPLMNEKSSVLLYRDSTYNLLVNISNDASGRFTVLDD
jgi:hypothetical protein